MKEIIFRKSDIDFNKIIEINLNRKTWGKKHLIYALGDLNVTCEMRRFDFSRNEAEFRIIITCPTKKDNFTSDRTITYNLSNMSLDFFKNYLEKQIISNLRWDIEYHLTRIAEDKFSDLKVYDIDDDDVINAGYEEELEEINEMSNKFQSGALATLEEEVLESLNEPYNNAVESWVNTHKVDNVNLYPFIENLRERIEKYKSV